MKRILVFALALASTLALFSCGIQREAAPNPVEGPIVQTKFLGAEFGFSFSQTRTRWARYRPINRDASILILDQSFGGNNWHFVEGHFVENMLSIVSFSQEYNNEEEAQSRFVSICRMLRMKYGELKPTEDGDGLYFTDEQKNTVAVFCHIGTARSGRSFWYCNLAYYWGPGSFLLGIKSMSEI